MLKATLSLRDSITHEVLSTEDAVAVRDDQPPMARTLSGYGCKLPTPYLHSEKWGKTGVNIIVTDIFEEVHPK